MSAEREKLESFINKEYSKECKKEILDTFPNYSIDECYNIDKYYLEYYIKNGIRVYIENSIIKEIQFG